MTDSNDTRPDGKSIEELHQAARELGELMGRLVAAVDGEIATQAALQALRADLDDLRAELAAEVRTRRLVVVGPAGEQWIEASAREHYAEVRVTTPNDHRGAAVVMAASLENDGDASLCVTGGLSGGDVVGTLRAAVGEGARLELDRPDATRGMVADCGGFRAY